MTVMGIGAPSQLYPNLLKGKTSLINSEGYDSRTHVAKTSTKAENEPIEQLQYLTANQKKELMEKYDIKNMKFGSKSHKDFMSDLVDMGVISQKDYDNSFEMPRLIITESSNPAYEGQYCYFEEDGKGGSKEVLLGYELSDEMKSFYLSTPDEISLYRLLEVSYDGYMDMYLSGLKSSYEKGTLPNDEYMNRAESSKRVFDVIQSIFE